MFRLSFATDNAAFDDGPATETARILRAIADNIAAGSLEGFARDSNGNRIGSYVLNGDGPADQMDGGQSLAMTDTPGARELGYTVEEFSAERWHYMRPDGAFDDEAFSDDADAWEAAESDAALWRDDHPGDVLQLKADRPDSAMVEVHNGVVTRSTLADFFAANMEGVTAADRSEIRAAIKAGESYRGATLSCAAFTLRRAD